MGEGTHLHNGSDKFLHKVMVKQFWPVVVDEVDDESFDVGAILVLICHDHQVAIPQRLHLCMIDISFVVLKAKNLHQILNFLIAHDLK